MPAYITTGPDGALWFTEYGVNQIGRVTTAGVMTEFPIPTAGSHPWGITTGPDGALWFTENSASRIGRITTAGAITEFPIPMARTFPAGITTGPDGALWFTGGDQIGRITTAGVISQFPLPAGVVTTAGSSLGITTGPEGALWFTVYAGFEPNGNDIGRVTTDGTITVYPRLYAGPHDIIAGPDGALWFTEVTTQAIARLTLTTFNSHDFDGNGRSLARHRRRHRALAHV